MSPNDDLKSAGQIAWGVISLTIVVILAPFYALYKLISLYTERYAIRTHQQLDVVEEKFVVDEDAFKEAVTAEYGQIKRTALTPCWSIVQRLTHGLPELSAGLKESTVELGGTTIAQSFADFTDALPPTALQTMDVFLDENHKPLFTVPLLDVTSNVGRSIEELVLPYFAKDLYTHNVFGGLRKQLEANQRVASGDRQALVMPSDSPLPKSKLADTYLRNTPFEGLFEAQVPFEINPRRWFEGTWIVAPQGRGKTNLLRHLILHHLPDACVIIMDAKGDLLETFRKHKPIRDRLVLLNPDAEHPLAINPLNIGHSNEFLNYIFELLNTEMTTNQTTLLTLVLLLCSKIPNANLETFRDILQNGWKPYEDAVRQLKKRDQDFFDKDWDTPLYKSRRPEVLSRLRTLMATPSFDEIFQSSTTKLDLGTMMDERKVVLINNNYEILGDKGSELFGRMFIALTWAAARRRSVRQDKKTPVFFFIDEAHLSIKNDTKIASIVQQCRSQNIAMIFAHQEVQQIKNEDAKGALANCAIKMANPTAEAKELASHLETTPDFLRALKQGTFALYVLDQTQNAISVSVPLISNTDNTLIDGPRMSEEEYQEVQQRSWEDYCYDPAAPPGREPEPEIPPPAETSEVAPLKPPKVTAIPPISKQVASGTDANETDAQPW